MNSRLVLPLLAIIGSPLSAATILSDWDAELKTLSGFQDIFWTIQAAPHREESSTQIFELSQIRGVLYGNGNEGGSIIYDGFPWQVGETRDFGGRKIKLEALSGFSDGSGRAQFNEGGTTREVQIGDAVAGIQRSVDSDPGWLVDDGREAIMPHSDGIKPKDRIRVILPNRGILSGYVTSISPEGWVHVSISKRPVLQRPKVSIPEESALVEIVPTAAGARQPLHVPYAVLKKELGAVPDWLRGAAVVDGTGALVGFISPSGPAKFVSAPPSDGKARFLSGDRVVHFER